MPKERLDVLLVESGLAESRSLAQRLIMAGEVRVNGQVEYKPAARVEQTAQLEVTHGQRFVSRGGDKLESAMRAFHVDVTGQICADVGASTGGFTDVLLQSGARKVYAIDVGYGILHWKLRNDPRVVCLERTNARYLASLPEVVEFVTIDASFISLKILLPVIRAWFPVEGGQAVALIKPQFEAGRKEADRGEGVIQDPAVHRQVLEGVLTAAQGAGYQLLGLMRSPLLGPKGNVEFLLHLAYPGVRATDFNALIEAVI